MSNIKTKIPMNAVELQIRKLEFADLIRQLKFMQKEEQELTARRFDLTQEFETAFQKSRVLFRTILAAHNHLYCEGRQPTDDTMPFVKTKSTPQKPKRSSPRISRLVVPSGEPPCR